MKADGSMTLDDMQKRTVIVIGDEVRRTLFPGRPAIGATILLNGIRFTVIGTLQKVGHGDNMNLNLRSFVPFHAMQNYFRPLNAGIATDVISFINYQPRSRALHEAAKQEVHKIIARNHGFDPKQSRLIRRMGHDQDGGSDRQDLRCHEHVPR